MENKRLNFERFAAAPPFEKCVDRWPNDPSKYGWPGAYKDINVEFAWESWKAAQETR